MYSKDNHYKIIYFFTALFSLFFIDNGNSLVEYFLKFSSTVILFLYYFHKVKKLNYYYVSILIISVMSSYLFIKEGSLLPIAVFLLFINRILYILIVKKGLKGVSNKTILSYLIIFVIPAIIIYYQLEFNFGSFTLTIVGITITTVILCTLAFVNYFNKLTAKNKLFALGVILFAFADILMAYSYFVHHMFLYVLIYTVLYYIGRYLVCEAMILEKN